MSEGRPTPQDGPMAGVTDQVITIPVTAGQYQQLSLDQLYPGRPRVTHRLTVGPFATPGNWVVVGAYERREPPQPTYAIMLARLED